MTIILYMLIGLFGALVLLYLLARGLADTESSDDLRQQHDAKMREEDAEEIKLLRRAMMYTYEPEDAQKEALKFVRQYPLGSPEQDAIMSEFKSLNKQHEAAQAERRRKIVDARMQGR